mmetsp:Transcript_76735/g.120881  ORF Transcript_76735/g.120881 Transcript_76735/m.120881 type:complete len:207 (-) Transcript_76735:444-1064(-)
MSSVAGSSFQEIGKPAALLLLGLPQPLGIRLAPLAPSLGTAQPGFNSSVTKHAFQVVRPSQGQDFGFGPALFLVDQLQKQLSTGKARPFWVPLHVQKIVLAQPQQFLDLLGICPWAQALQRHKQLLASHHSSLIIILAHASPKPLHETFLTQLGVKFLKGNGSYVHGSFFLSIVLLWQKGSSQRCAGFHRGLPGLQGSIKLLQDLM